MSINILLGAERAPVWPAGRDNGALGPSDSSDSGSDAGGMAPQADTDRQGTGERSSVAGNPIQEGADILPDRVIGDPDDAQVDPDEPREARAGVPLDPDTAQALNFDDDAIEDPTPRGTTRAPKA